MIVTATPTSEPIPEWLLEALSYRHSTRSVILVGLEDGRYAILDEQTKDRRYLVCDSLSDVEKDLMGLRDRRLERPKPIEVKKNEAAHQLLRDLNLL